MNTLSTLSPAKLNLFLHITGKREDGYHNLQTVFRLLDWGDHMRFEISTDLSEDNKPPVRLHCDIQLTDNPHDNLIIKSAFALLDYVNTPLFQPLTGEEKSLPVKERLRGFGLPIIDIHLHKKIPTGAGLGGGSSNAATTLMALNQLWKLGLSNEQLQQIGTKLGADIPIFIYGKDAIAEGIGEVFTSIYLPKQQYLLLTPSAHISTSELFAHPKLKRNIEKLTTDQIIKSSVDFTDSLTTPYRNVFQPVVCDLSNKVHEALAYLQQFEPVTHSIARMTGSGSCVFLPIPSHISETSLDTWITYAPCTAIVTNSL